MPMRTADVVSLTPPSPRPSVQVVDDLGGAEALWLDRLGVLLVTPELCARAQRERLAG